MSNESESEAKGTTKDYQHIILDPMNYKAKDAFNYYSEQTLERRKRRKNKNKKKRKRKQNHREHRRRKDGKEEEKIYKNKNKEKIEPP